MTALSTTGQPCSAANASIVARRVAHPAPGRARHAERGQPLAHDGLVLGVHQRVGAGAHRDAVGRQRPDVLGGHVLVVERDHVAALGEVAQVVQVAVVAEPDVGDRPGAALSSGAFASTRSSMPRAIAACWVIRASWPPPTMPTTGPMGLAKEGLLTTEVYRPPYDVRPGEDVRRPQGRPAGAK